MILEITTSGAQPEMPLTMSSREIAELTGKEHKNVLRDIKSILAGLNSEPSFFEGSYVDRTGRTLRMFNLPKRECLILVSGYDVGLRARIIDRWIELETAKTAPVAFDPSDPQVLLQVFGALQSKVEEQKILIAEQGEKVARLERIENSDGSLCLRDAAKTLKVQPKNLNTFMNARKWIYKRVGHAGWVAYQDKIRDGFMEHADHQWIDKEGRERVASQARVTARGLVKLAELLNAPLH